jgi:hypothetical protein
MASHDRRRFVFPYRGADGVYRLALVKEDGSLVKEWAKFDRYAVPAGLSSSQAVVLVGNNIDQLDTMVRVDSLGHTVLLNKEKVLQRTGVTIGANLNPLKVWLDGAGDVTFGIEGLNNLVQVAGSEFDYAAPPPPPPVLPPPPPIQTTPNPPSRITERPRKPFTKAPRLAPREQKEQEQ